MGISTKQLEDERAVLQKAFDELNVKIKTVEGETQKMRNNLNAVHGAIQEIDKLMKLDFVTGNQAIKDELKAAKQGGLEIKEKEEAQLLNENDKWKKIGIAL